MNVQEACVVLRDLLQADVQAVQGGDVPAVMDPFPETGSDDFLAGTAEDLSINLTDLELLNHKLVGIQESNAFLAALQKADEARKRSRLQVWADVYSQKNRVSSGRGALIEQLRGLGVKVDDEWLIKVFAAAAQAAKEEAQ